MKKVSWFLNDIIRPSNARETINIIVFTISISFVYVSFSSFSSNALSDVLVQVIRTIGASGTATTIIQYVNQTAEKFEKSRKEKEFLTLFGCGNNRGIPITFLLPGFEIRGVPQEEQQSNSIDWKQWAYRNFSENPTKGSINNDVKAASYLISAYSKILSSNNSLSLPEIKWDENFIKENSEEKVFYPQEDSNNNSKNVYFIIGFSNRYFVYANQEDLPERYFFIEREEGENIENKISICYFSDGERIEQENWGGETVKTRLGERRPIGDYDYGILAKLNLRNNTVLICAAITEIGTLKLADYISMNWEKVYEKLKNEKNNRTLEADEAFTVLFKIPINYDTSENVTMPRICINEEN